MNTSGGINAERVTASLTGAFPHEQVRSIEVDTASIG